MAETVVDPLELVGAASIPIASPSGTAHRRSIRSISSL